MRVLLFCDDYYHPGEVPEKGMEPLREKGFEIDIIFDTSNFDSEIIFNYDVIVMSKCDHVTKEDNRSWKTPEVQEAFIQFVINGGGVLFTHSGVVRGTENDTSLLDNLAGCYFEFHPNNSPVTVGALKPHPVTKGVNIFCQEDEHYHIKILANDIDIIAASYTPDQGESDKYETEPYFNAREFISPCVYVRTQGKGRVCVITCGHNLNVWLNSEFQKMLTNALKWCGHASANTIEEH